MYRQFNNHQNQSRNFNKRAQTSRSELMKMINSVNAAKIAKSAVQDETHVAQHKFEDFPICDQIKRNIFSKNFTSPTPIQDQAIPAIMDGKDIIGIANTGTGKTVAFLIPLIDKVFKNRNEKVLIIAPTRELTLQINEEFNYFARGTGLKSALCIGGISTFGQKNILRQNPNFVIGTPGRIKDFIQRKALHLSQFNNVVLDEADRMVDIGFIHEVKYFISLLPKKRQSLFFSATVSGKVKEILDGFVTNPVVISVKQQDVTQNINQEIFKVMHKERKIDQLHNLLRQDGFHKILIFGRTKRGIQKLADELVKRGFRAGAIHGNKRQNQRQKTLDQFKRNEIKILLATDVASRGLDINDVSHVINYDTPATYEDYVHRIGRTGRANKTGTALTFID